jgi:hypothetical protein
MEGAKPLQKRELDNERSYDEAKVQEPALQAEGAKVAAHAVVRNHQVALKERGKLQADLDAMAEIVPEMHFSPGTEPPVPYSGPSWSPLLLHSTCLEHWSSR